MKYLMKSKFFVENKKYIKLFEGYEINFSNANRDGDFIYDNTEETIKKYPYKIGDIIHYQDNNKPEGIYVIAAIDPKDFVEFYRICDVFDIRKGGWLKKNVKKLQLLSDDEIKNIDILKDVIKYNL
jgi:hypothetical protein